MFCKSCGKELRDGQDVCLNCGFGKNKGNSFCQHCGVAVKAEQEICVACGKRLCDLKEENSTKSKLVAGLLQILLPFGIGRFYLGYTQIAILQIIVTIVTCGAGTLWSIIDGIMILCDKVPDIDGKKLQD